MTREEAEKIIKTKWIEIVKLYLEYNPEATYLSACYIHEDKEDPEETFEQKDFIDIHTINSVDEKPFDIHAWRVLDEQAES